MGFDPPTTADFANHAAGEALQANKKLEARIKELEDTVRGLKLRLSRLERR